MKILKKQKSNYEVFIQSTIVPNFNMIVPFLTFIGCYEVLTQN